MASKKLHRAATTVVTYRLPASSVCSCMSSTPKRRTAEYLGSVAAATSCQIVYAYITQQWILQSLGRSKMAVACVCERDLCGPGDDR
jgi:hypothetical protein